MSVLVLTRQNTTTDLWSEVANSRWRWWLVGRRRSSRSLATGGRGVDPPSNGL